jgi:hypothetical protein
MLYVKQKFAYTAAFLAIVLFAGAASAHPGHFEQGKKGHTRSSK